MILCLGIVADFKKLNVDSLDSSFTQRLGHLRGTIVCDIISIWMQWPFHILLAFLCGRCGLSGSRNSLACTALLMLLTSAATCRGA